MMTNYKKISQRVIEEVCNQKKTELIGELVAPGFVMKDPLVAVSQKGRAAVESYLDFWQRAVPDLRFRIEEQVAEGDRVMTRLMATGTHEGELLNIPPTHRKADVPCFLIDRFQDDKIIETQVYWDAYAFLKAVGALEMLKPALVTA